MWLAGLCNMSLTLPEYTKPRNLADQSLKNFQMPNSLHLFATRLKLKNSSMLLKYILSDLSRIEKLNAAIAQVQISHCSMFVKYNN